MSVYAVPLAGGTLTTLASGYRTPLGLAVGSGQLYWTDATATTNNWVIWRMPVTGGAPTAIVSGVHPIKIAVDATSIYWTDTSGSVLKAPR